MAKASGSADKASAQKAVAMEYMKKNCGLNQATVDGLSPDALKEKLI